MEFAHTVFRVALSGDASMLLQILSENPNLVNLPDFDGNMPLHFAAMSGSSECVKICISALKARLDLDCGTEVRRRNFMGKDALTISIEKGDYESFSLLLSAGAETDYRCTDDVPPLVAALSQDNVELTANVLDTLEINFLRLRRDHYWILTLHTDLSISLIYLKLLKAHAVPYILSEFEEICATVLEKEPSTKGIEEFLIYLGSDAVERWSIHLEQVHLCLMRISSYFLRKIVPFSQNFTCIHRLQKSGLYIPPSSARTWLRVLSQWGFPKIYVEQPDIQKQLIWNLADINRNPRTTVPDRCLLPLVLYFSVLALRFPHSDWINCWHEVCSKANFSEHEYNLGTLLELHSIRQSKSVFDFFWHNIFTFAISRAVLYADLMLLSLNDIQRSMDKLLNHAYHECPLLQPQVTEKNHEKLIYLLSYFPASNNIPGHKIFIFIVYRHFLPLISDDDIESSNINSNVLMTATVHVLHQYALLNLIVNFSAKLGLKFLSNLQDWPRSVSADDKIKLFHILIACYIESSQDIKVPRNISQMLSLNEMSNDRCNHLNNSAHNWLSKWLSEPKSLLLWSKITIRTCIRRSAQHRSLPKQPVNELIRHLPLAPMIQEYLIDNEYSK
ncbi:hypothetical protein KSF78_0005847 [Schistosoma japonicum]|nr:hypothetical protein KSF78_0005847 [Schistosoma japonicum]